MKTLPLVFCGLVLASASASAAERLALRALSGRPDLVTGGSVLVEIAGSATESLHVAASERDVTSVFRPNPERGTLLGRIEGLKPGKNILEARSGRQRARLEIVNHPIAGPVISGPHQIPFACSTETAGLGPAIDENCSANSKVTYYYKSTERAGRQPVPGTTPGFKILDLSAPRPADIAKTSVGEGRTVNYIVRVEAGTINRAVYRIAFLHEPGEPLPNPWTRTPGWNGRLVYLFGGGCQAGYHQGLPAAALDDALLSKGYATAKSSLNVSANNCDDVISAETCMMVKEHFIKNYGIPVYTIGGGGSGGSIQQYLIAQNYPGLLDGITAGNTFPDLVTLVAPVLDCTLLARAFDRSAQPWSEAQKTAVSGFATWETCGSWMKDHFSPGWVETGWCSVPKDKLYHPVKNPRGVRCTIQDNQVNVYGRDDKDGFAPGFVDNTGVQYGLAAFERGMIGAEQFVELNERVGGFDRDGNTVAQRSAASPQALRAAYRTGRVNVAAGSLGSIPIIDYRWYLDNVGNIHDRMRSFALRTRLTRAHGHANNHVMLSNIVFAEVIPMMDRWLDRIGRDKSPGTPAEKVVRGKPEDLRDTCSTAQGERIAEPVVYGGSGRCDRMYPAYADPRIVAGAPLANDVLKCSLRPLRAEDYSHPLSKEQFRRLQAIFPEGVCDYSRPGLEQAGPAPQPWRKY